MFAKLSPNVTDLVAIAGAALDAGATGLTLVNTVMGLVVDASTRAPRLGAGGGGLSGPPIKPIALRAVWEVSRAHPGRPDHRHRRRRRPARTRSRCCSRARRAVGVGTATFPDPRATLRIVDELGAWCARNGVARVRDLIGGLRS